MQSGCEDTLEERHAIKFCFKLGKTATETYGMLQTAYGPSCMNRSSVFQWHKRFKEGRESVRDDERCGRSREVRTSEMIPFFDSMGIIYIHWVPTGITVNKEYYIEVLREFRKRFRRKRPELFESGQWHFHQDNAPVHNSILITDYLTQMGIKTVPHPPYSPDLAPCNFWLFPKLKENLRGNRYSTIEDMKEAVTRVLNTLTQEDFQGAFQKLLERYNKCIDVGGEYFEGD